MGMSETAYYVRFEAGFDAVPAENYVDYMTNVMPVSERHLFYLIRREVGLMCEVKIDQYGRRVLMWSLRKHDTIPANIVEIQIEENKVNAALECLNDSDLPRKCDVCDENFGALLRFF